MSVELTYEEGALVTRLIEFARENGFFEDETDDEVTRQEYAALLPIADRIQEIIVAALGEPPPVVVRPEVLRLVHVNGTWRCPHCDGTEFSEGVVLLNRRGYTSGAGVLEEGALLQSSDERADGDFVCQGCDKPVEVTEEMFG